MKHIAYTLNNFIIILLKFKTQGFLFFNFFDRIEYALNPLQYNRGVAQMASALPSGGRGRWFKSSHPDFQKLKTLTYFAEYCGGISDQYLRLGVYDN